MSQPKSRTFVPKLFGAWYLRCFYHVTSPQRVLVNTANLCITLHRPMHDAQEFGSWILKISKIPKYRAGASSLLKSRGHKTPTSRWIFSWWHDSYHCQPILWRKQIKYYNIDNLRKEWFGLCKTYEFRKGEIIIISTKRQVPRTKHQAPSTKY